MDGILHVCRAFEDPDVIHTEDRIDPVEDLDIIHRYSVNCQLPDAHQEAWMVVQAVMLCSRHKGCAAAILLCLPAAHPWSRHPEGRCHTRTQGMGRMMLEARQGIDPRQPACTTRS